MNSAEFKDILTTIKNNWETKIKNQLENLLSNVKSGNPYSPLVKASIDADWNNYKQTYHSFLKELEEKFSNHTLDVEQSQFLDYIRKAVLAKLLQEWGLLKQGIEQKALEMQSFVPIPDFEEQALSGEIFPDNPAYYQVGW